MHVLMLIYGYWPEQTGGAERQCRKLSHALVRAGVRVTVLTGRQTPSSPLAESDHGVEVVRIPLFSGRRGGAKPSVAATPSSGGPRGTPRFLRRVFGTLAAAILRGMNTLRFACRARREARRLAPDVLHVHTTTWIAGVGAWIGRGLGVPVLCKETTFPAFPRTPPFVFLRSCWERMRMGNGFIAQHPAAAASIAACGVPSDRIAIIPNGVEMPDVAARAEDPGIVLFVGNLTQGIHDKGIDTLLSAWELTERRVPLARLLVAGAEGRHPVRLSEGEEKGHRVECLGYVAEIEGLFRRAAVVVVPSRREGMSNVLLEAMGWGIPVVGTDIPGNRAVLKDGVTGLLVPVGEPQPMAEALVKLLDDAALRLRLGAAARRHVAEAYEIGAVAGQMHRCYEKVIAVSPAGLK